MAATSLLSVSRSLTTLGTSYKWDGSHSICLLVTGLFHLEYPQRDFPDGSAVKNLPPMQEMQVGPLGQEAPLEEEMATHYNILAWKIPWTEEPGSLQSLGLQRVRHD